MNHGAGRLGSAPNTSTWSVVFFLFKLRPHGCRSVELNYNLRIMTPICYLCTTLHDTPHAFRHVDSWFIEHCGLTVVIPTYTFSQSVNSRVPHGTSCPPLITYVNSTDAPCIFSPKWALFCGALYKLCIIFWCTLFGLNEGLTAYKTGTLPD